MEGFYGILYELVCPMLASDSCVKCITEDGSTTFTSDPEHLLRNVDIEHPAGELVLNALQSHKHTFGTGTKTLLFMLASLAKAVVQLSKLGIHSDDSLDVIRDVLTDLAKEVQEISIDVNECCHSSKQDSFRRKNCVCNKNVTYMSGASDNPKSQRKLIPCEQTEALHTPEVVLQQHVEKRSLLNTHSDFVCQFNGSGGGEECCLLPDGNSCVLHSILTSNICADSHPDLCHSSSIASFSTKEYYSNEAKLELNSVMCQKSGGVTSTCSDKETVVTEVTEAWDHKVKWKSDGDSRDTQCASTDSVFLKMSNLQYLSGNIDDIDWFFNNPSSYSGCPEVNNSFENSHVSQDVTKSSNTSPDCFLFPEDKDCRACSLDSPEHKIQWNGLNINSHFYNSKDLLSSELQNMGCVNHENKVIADGGIHSLIDGEQYSSDFVNCFDEYDKKQTLELTYSISSGELDNKVNDSKTKCSLVFKSDSFGSKLSSNLMHKTFIEDLKFSLAGGQLSEKDCDDVDEFDACFNDIGEYENASVKHVDDSEFPSSFHMADNQFSNKYDGSNECDACSDIDVQDLSVTCENAVIKHVNDSDYPLPYHTLEMLNNIKQKDLFPKEARTPCSVKVTNSMLVNDCTNNSLYGNGIFKDRITISSMESSDIVTQKSEIERLNTLLGMLQHSKSHVDLPKISRHFNHFQDKNLQHEKLESNLSDNNIDISEIRSLHLIENTHCQGYLKDTDQDGGNLSLGISAYDVKNTLQAHEDYNACAVENDPFNCFQEHSIENNSSDQRNSALYSEVHNDKHKSIKDKQLLLDQLLLQKKATFRSTIAEKLMLSSRHFSKNSGNNMGCSSLLHEDSELTKCSPNVGNEYFSYSNHIVTQDLSKGSAESEETAEFDMVKDSRPVLQNELVAVSDSSDDRLQVCTYLQDHHVQPHTHACSETSDINCLQDPGCCHPAEMPSGLLVVPKEHYSADQPREVIHFLHDCKSDVGVAAEYIFRNQIKDKEDARFNFHLVNCLILPSMASLPQSLTSSCWRSTATPVSVVPGLIIPCDSQILEQLHTDEQPLVTLLINGDLTPNFHHKGYVPTLPKRTLIAKPHHGKEESGERLWCTDMLTILNQLNVKLLLVKGKASSVLLDMCEVAGVLLLPNISYQSLSVLSHLHKVDIVTYLALATEANLCTVRLQPLSTSWMDHLQDTQLNTASQFAVITTTPDVQTAIIHCSTTMSAQLIEEKLWKCLYSIANLQADAKVLPGQGKTEIWCAKRINYKSKCMLGNRSSMQSVILETVADIFQDYYQTVTLNTQFYVDEHIKTKNGIKINPLSTPQCKNYVSFPEHNCFLKLHHSSHESIQLAELQTDNKSFKMVTGNHMKQIVSIELDVSKPPESCYEKSSVANMLNASSSNTFPDFSSSENISYDNFKSKISAWKTAADVVSVLHNLGSLVISGIDTVDITEDISLL
ncbi:hypothetical protein BsWGS_01702 [Bradybaena similaris]